MVDFHLEAVHAFWDNYDRHTLYRVIVALECVEHWALDEVPEVEAALICLGEAMEQASNFELTEEAKFIHVLANIRASRALRLLQALDIAKPGSVSQLLMYAEEVGTEGEGKTPDPYAQLFLRRNLVFERLQLLARMFAPQRLSLILKALEQQVE